MACVQGRPARLALVKSPSNGYVSSRIGPLANPIPATVGTSAMKAAILVFPGINRERDMARALKLISGHEPAMVWHAETSLPAGTDLVVVPGGFS